MRALLRLLTVISVAFGATQLPAQSSFSPQDTLAYTTASVRLREKPAPTARVRRGLVQRRGLQARGLRARGVPQYAATADCPKPGIRQLAGPAGGVADADGEWSGAGWGFSEVSRWDVQFQSESAGDAFASWGSGGVVVGVVSNGWAYHPIAKPQLWDQRA